MKILHIVGKCKICLINDKHLCIEYNTRNTYHVDYPVIYDDLTVAYDNPYVLPKYIKQFFERHAAALNAHIQHI